MRFLGLVARALWPFDRALALVAFIGVWSYRRWISPHKGFQCAHGVLTGEPSCSEFAASLLRRETLTVALPQIREQFRRCRRTYASRRADLFDAASSHLSQFSALAAGGVLGCPCIPGCDDDNGRKPPPPLPMVPAAVRPGGSA